MRETFRAIASVITHAVGTPYALLIAIVVIAVWAATGPVFHFSDTWQLVINTATTIVTFLMVFVIQATQNREAKATQLKLDELIHAIGGARNRMIALDEAPDETVEEAEQEFREIADRAVSLTTAKTTVRRTTGGTGDRTASERCRRQRTKAK